MERYNQNINVFPRRVMLRTRYTGRAVRPHTISRNGVVRTPGFVNSPPRPSGRNPKLCNRVKFVERANHGFSVRLLTAELMVDSFYSEVPGFATHIVYLDGNERNINIANLLPLFGPEEEQQYYIERLSRENNCRVSPAMSILLNEDYNLDNFLVTDTGRIYSIKSKQWMQEGRSYGYPSVKLRFPRRTNPNILIQRGFMIHRLVCRAFHGPPPGERIYVDHIDNNPFNNNSNNLRWVTQAENLRYRQEQPPRARVEPIPQQPVLQANPEWTNIGMYLGNRDLSNYEVCRQGIVRDIRDPGVQIEQRVSGMGYFMVRLRDIATRQESVYPVHKLIAYTFHRDTYRPETPVVDHINENKLDNRAENLRWVTSTVNTADALGVRVRMTDINTGETTDYPSIQGCLNDYPLQGLKHHLSGTMDLRLYGNLQFQRIDPLRPRQR